MQEVTASVSLMNWPSSFTLSFSLFLLASSLHVQPHLSIQENSRKDALPVEKPTTEPPVAQLLPPSQASSASPSSPPEPHTSECTGTPHGKEQL